MTKPRFSLVPTDEYVEVNGVKTRIFRGSSHGGTIVEVLVAAVGVLGYGDDKPSFDATFEKFDLARQSALARSAKKATEGRR